MAISMYRHDDHTEIHVDDPGHGYIHVIHYPPTRHRINPGARVTRTLAGRELWQALESLTELAVGSPGRGRPLTADPTRGVVTGLWSMTVDQARELLPALQTAVVYAAAGSDRAERLTEDGPHDVLCVNCTEGSGYTPPEPCTRHGHSPFGYPYGVGWDAAQRWQDRTNRWIQTRRQLSELGYPTNSTSATDTNDPVDPAQAGPATASHHGDWYDDEDQDPNSDQDPGPSGEGNPA